MLKKNKSFSCSSLLIFWTFLNCFLICVPLPLHNHVSPLGGHSNCLILRIFVAPARLNSNGPFMSVPSPPRNEIVCFMRKPTKSLPNLLQLQEFTVPNKPLVILFVATCWLRQFWGFEFHNLLLKLTGQLNSVADSRSMPLHKRVTSTCCVGS